MLHFQSLEVVGL